MNFYKKYNFLLTLFISKLCYREKMPNSICINGECGCPTGSVAFKKRGEPPRCLPGLVPCKTSGECSRIHPLMVCSGKSRLLIVYNQTFSLKL